MDDSLPKANGDQELLNVVGVCNDEGQHNNGAYKTSLRHIILSNVLENAIRSLFGNIRGSSRSSTCKRKNCT
jgi:hypothetical protein